MNNKSDNISEIGFERYMVFGMHPQNGGVDLPGLGGVIVSKDDRDHAIFISENVGSVYKTAYVFDRILGRTIHTWSFNPYTTKNAICKFLIMVRIIKNYYQSGIVLIFGLMQRIF